MDKTRRLLKLAVFIHSLGIYDYGKHNLEEAITAAGKNGLGLGVVQLGPVGDEYFGAAGLENREKLVSILKREEVTVGPLCVCYEQKGKRGAQEIYAPNIEAIVKTGGYGHEDLEIVKQRIAITRDHIDLARYLKDKEVMSSDRAILTTHVGFFDRPEKRNQIKEAVKEVIEYCKERNVYFAIETGSEPMDKLVEFIQEIEGEMDTEGRLGINYDPANFYLYGTQDPLKALEYLKGKYKKYLFGVHAKDAPEGELIGEAKDEWKAGGCDVPLGKGTVQWEPTLKILCDDLEYSGPLVIEREAQDIEPGVMEVIADKADKLKAEIIRLRKLDIKTAMTGLREYGHYVA